MITKPLFSCGKNKAKENHQKKKKKKKENPAYLTSAYHQLSVS